MKTMEKIREKIREKSWNIRKNEHMFEKTNLKSEKSVPFSNFKFKTTKSDLKNRRYIYIKRLSLARCSPIVDDDL